jgi:hypothetical protein
MTDEKEPLAPELREAERTLKTTLDEACSSDPARADTGELIRIEEMLAIASDAAKRAVSIRRKLRQTGTAASLARERDAPRGATEPVRDESASEHRTFTDSHGVEWAVWSVHPSERPSKRSQLRGSYSHGWLAFESGTEKRRLSPIPENWHHLDEAGLEALCTVAESAPPRVLRRLPDGETTRNAE